MRTLLYLENNRFLWACHSRTGRNSRLWLVYLPESGASFHTGTRAELAGLIGRGPAQDYHYLVVNKPGLTPQGKNEEVFERSFRRRLRIRDAQAAITAVIPGSHKISLLGYSEGAYLAPQVALALGPRVERIGMVGGGTRGWLEEELSNAFGREKSALRRQVERIRQESGSLAKWNGFSFATWNSYDADSTLSALRRLPKDLPLLSILGAKDRVIDFESAAMDLRGLSAKRAVQLEILKKCGHSFSGHWPEVRRILSHFYCEDKI